MKNLSLLVLLLACGVSYAAKNAITDTGEAVVLNENGTWQYVSELQGANSGIPFDETPLIKPEAATFLVKSTNSAGAYWIDPSKWEFTKAIKNTEAEYEFKLQGEDLYGMAITERISIPLETLSDVAFENARAASPGIRVQEKVYKNVNGIKVLYMVMRGVVRGIDITYFGYYYSDASGSSQYLVYTGTNLVSKYEDEISDVLNGFDIQ